MEPMWIITICSFGIVLILHVLNLSNQNNKIQLGFLVLMGLIVNGFSLFNLSFTERDHAISLRQNSELKPVQLKCTACGTDYEQQLTLDMANFFAPAS
jgi:hypothetical protein